MLQSIALGLTGLDCNVDDVIGMIVSTAAPFGEDPANPQTYRPKCQACPRDQYGQGIMNLDDAAEIMSAFASGGLVRNVARKNGGHIVPGSWEFTRLDSVAVVDTTWVCYRASAQVVLNSLGLRDNVWAVPQGWVRRKNCWTNTMACYSHEMPSRIQVARAGIRDCYLSVIDKNTGDATISGYDYAWHVGTSGPLHFLTPEDQLEMEYVTLPTACAVRERPNATVGGLRIEYIRNRPNGTVAVLYRTTVPADVNVRVFNVLGQEVLTNTVRADGSGIHEWVWTGLAQGGERAAAGVYWVQMQCGASKASRRLVMVR